MDELLQVSNSREYASTTTGERTVRSGIIDDRGDLVDGRDAPSRQIISGLREYASRL
jgi:hypothetical protein